jgi:hypothetical protein
MLRIRHLGWCAPIVFASFVLIALTSAHAQRMPPPQSTPGIIQVKLGFSDMSRKERKNLWKMVDQYATIDALQEFCGKRLNLQRRAWRAVGACVERRALKRVFSVFRSKKAKYLKAWKELHGEEEKKEALCKQFRLKLIEYAKIMSGQISEAANMCRNCFFC